MSGAESSGTAAASSASSASSELTTINPANINTIPALTNNGNIELFIAANTSSEITNEAPFDAERHELTKYIGAAHTKDGTSFSHQKHFPLSLGSVTADEILSNIRGKGFNHLKQEAVDTVDNINYNGVDFSKQNFIVVYLQVDNTGSEPAVYNTIKRDNNAEREKKHPINRIYIFNNAGKQVRIGPDPEEEGTNKPTLFDRFYRIEIVDNSISIHDPKTGIEVTKLLTKATVITLAKLIRNLLGAEIKFNGRDIATDTSRDVGPRVYGGKKSKKHRKRGNKKSKKRRSIRRLKRSRTRK
jgi:hypothetical protein